VSKFEFLKAARPVRSRVSKKPRTQNAEMSMHRQAGPGRPPGKRTDPGFVQVTAYIRRDTHGATKMRLLQEGQGRDFSELVEGLLADWLKRG